MFKMLKFLWGSFIHLIEFSRSAISHGHGFPSLSYRAGVFEGSWGLVMAVQLKRGHSIKLGVLQKGDTKQSICQQQYPIRKSWLRKGIFHSTTTFRRHSMPTHAYKLPSKRPWWIAKVPRSSGQHLAWSPDVQDWNSKTYHKIARIITNHIKSHVLYTFTFKDL